MKILKIRLSITLSLILILFFPTLPTHGQDVEAGMSVTIPIPSKGLVLFEAKTNNNGNISGTIISRDFANQLELNPKEKTFSLTLDLNGKSVTLKAKIGDAPNNWMSNTLKRKYQCLVGYDFFENYLITIDYPASKLTISSYLSNIDDIKKNHKKATELKFDYLEHAALVKCKVWKDKETGFDTSFFIDCGMTGNSIDKAHYQKLQTPLKSKVLTTVPILDVAGSTFKDVPFHIIDVPTVQEVAKGAKKDVAGLLGRPFLEKYRVTLDYKGYRIFLDDSTSHK